MRTTIYWLTTDTDDGIRTWLFTSEKEQQKARWRFVKECWDRCFDVSVIWPDDLDKSWDRLTSQVGFMDSCNWGEEEIETGFVPTMDLIQLHGRMTVDEDMKGWGFDGPTLKGVKAMHVTYCSTYALYFVDEDAANKARELTGWRFWDTNALELRFDDGMLKSKNDKGEDCFFGDWELQTIDGTGKIVSSSKIASAP
jgi:hypothetical protein